jgi:zinc transport system ATP-binding protein
MAERMVIPLQSAEAAAPGAAPGAGEALVAGHGLSLTLGRRQILRGIDIAVHSGEIVTIIGPNGAGKTSLARILLGILKPSSGHVVRKPGLRIGYVPQRFPVDPSIPLDVRRFLTLGVRAGREAIEAVLAEVGAAHLIGQQVASLSGGELQRVCLARALVGAPELLVLDEPAQAVDFSGEIQLYRLIAEIRNRRHCGILMISHDLHVVLGASDRVICLSGHICCEGVPDKVASHPEYARLFGREAGKAVAIYRHHHDHEHDLSGGVSHVHGPDCGHHHD